MNKLNLRRTLAAASFAGLMAAGSAAQAQVWFEYRPWGGPTVYEEAPPVVYGRQRFAAPEYMAPDALPPAVVRSIVQRRGFGVIGPIRLSGDVYVVPVEDRRGRTLRIVVDAASGELVERLPFAGPPRPPANMGRTRDRYATAPYAIDPYSTDLPQAPPRGGWRDDGYALSVPRPVPPPAVNESERRARERFARQTPDGAVLPRGGADDFETAPRLRPGQAAPKREPVAKPSPTRDQTKPAAKQQAARTPPESKKPAIAKPAIAKPETVKPQTVKPEAAKPIDQPKVQAAKPEVSKPTPAKREAVRSAPEPNTTVVAPTPKPEPKKQEARKPDDKRNASILRRPSQKVDDAKPGEGKGVAEAPVISSGAAPQRKAPRIVYPGPGTSAPATSSE